MRNIKNQGIATRKGRKQSMRAPKPAAKPRGELPTRPDHVAVEVRRNLVAKCLERGAVTYRLIREILLEHGIEASAPVVSKDISAIRDEWSDARVSDFEKARDVARNMVLASAREAWDGWIASQSEQVVTKSVFKKGRGKGAKPELVPDAIERKSTPGNPEFIGKIQAAIDQLCKIDGLHSKIKIDLSADAGLAELAAMIGVAQAQLPKASSAAPGAPVEAPALEAAPAELDPPIEVEGDTAES